MSAASQPSPPLLSRQAYDRVRDLILAGAVGIDEPISERGLAEALGLGRTPVREAVKELERDGLLTSSLGRGTFLRRISLDEVRELYEVRIGLEGIAAEMAARRGMTPELDQLAKRLATLSKPRRGAPDVAELQRVGGLIHYAIFDAAGNRQLRSIFQRLHQQVTVALSLTREHQPSRVLETVAEHLAVVEAIRKGDARRAHRLMVRHLTNAIEARNRIFTRFAGSGGRSQDAPNLRTEVE